MLLFLLYLQTPSTSGEWYSIAKDFNERWNFLNAIGALEGKHIMIQPPPDSGSYYFNYKNTHSIILLALVNANYEFIYADVGTNGRASDAGVWNQCDLKASLEAKTLGIPPPNILPNSLRCLPFVILGDDAFPLGLNLMKPFPFRNQTLAQRVFSYRLSRARRVVENAFGILSNKFRIFLSPINLAPKKVEKIVLATLVMHNLLRRVCPDYTAPGNINEENLEEGSIIRGAWNQQPGVLIGLENSQTRNATTEAKSVRLEYMQYFNEEGAVPWQETMIGVQ